MQRHRIVSGSSISRSIGNVFLDGEAKGVYDNPMADFRNRTTGKSLLKPRYILILLVIVVVLFVFLISRFMVPRIIGRPASIDHGCTYEQGMRIMVHAKGYINTDLTYDGSYFQGGYPPDDIGVCTDVVWKGMQGLDVNFKDEIDKDVESDFTPYSSVIAEMDPNIDFRLVPVLRVYYDRHAVSLTTDPSNLLDWQPGDLVVFEDEHIAVVSCLRNPLGYPYLIQHGRDPAADEDRLLVGNDLIITGHYRWPQTITIGGANEESTDNN